MLLAAILTTVFGVGFAVNKSWFILLPLIVALYAIYYISSCLNKYLAIKFLKIVHYE